MTTSCACALVVNGQSEFIWYHHPDHLGSTGFVTDQNGELYEHVEYFPFGETWVQEKSNTQRTPYLYTGKELDEETGLYYYGARYYDPRTSVWVSTDPILGQYLDGQRGLGGIFNPVTLGLYSYSHANPVKYYDPDGRDVAIFLDRQAAGRQGHSAIAVFEKGGKGKVTYLSYGPEDSGKPMHREFKTKSEFLKFLSESTYEDKPKQGSGFNYDEVVVLKTTPLQDRVVAHAGTQEVQKKEWDFLGNLFGNETSDNEVNCKDMSRNSLAAGGIRLPNRMRPNDWQGVVNKSPYNRNQALEGEIQGALNSRNEAVRREDIYPQDTRYYP